MKIAVDISQVIYGTGVSVYTKKLVGQLLENYSTGNEFTLFGGSLRRYKELRKTARDLGSKSKIMIYPIPPTISDLLWNRLHFITIDGLIGRNDILHSSDWTQPPTYAAKVTTVHDLMAVFHPEVLHPNIVSVQKRRLKWVKSEADLIIVPSISTREELIKFGVESKRIEVIYEAPVLSGNASVSTIQKIKNKYNLNKSYLLAFGSGPYKNTKNITKAFENSGLSADFDLVVVGRESVKTEKIGENVKFTGFVSNSDLQPLFSGASALVFASLYEGFGQPILEAFQSGIPVVTSNTSSMPEVAGNAAVLVDPENQESIADGIKIALKKRAHYINIGYDRVKNFSWKRTAELTFNSYKKALG